MIADETADPELVAADLLGPGRARPTSPAVLITTSRELGARGADEIDGCSRRWPTRDVAGAAWRDARLDRGRRRRDEAIALADEIAPEHLEVQVAEDELDVLPRALRNYGSLFLGEQATVAYGDKAIGTNHVLPTMARRALHRRPVGREVPEDLHLPAADRGGHAADRADDRRDLRGRALRRPRADRDDAPRRLADLSRT